MATFPCAPCAVVTLTIIEERANNNPQLAGMCDVTAARKSLSGSQSLTHDAPHGYLYRDRVPGAHDKDDNDHGFLPS